MQDRPAYPLAGWAERQISIFRELTGAPALRDLRGAGLLVERAGCNGFTVPGAISAGGGCRLLPAQDGWIALNLAREDDRALLPALFLDGDLDPTCDDAIAVAASCWVEQELVARGREMGLAIAGMTETHRPSPITMLRQGMDRSSANEGRPLVVDLSALWAGPLAGHLLWLAGADVVKVESPTRPDRMRDGDPGLFALLNQGKANVALDLRDAAGREALITLITRADMVIEAARPRALRQLGIDADALAQTVPGLVWISITGHGVEGDAADWVGFGDDCGVAGGLSATLHDLTGTPAFVGDAIGDPLTGIMAALAAWRQWSSGRGAHLAFSMSGIVRTAMEEECATDRPAFEASLRQWADRRGQAIAPQPMRQPTAPLAPLGADNATWLPPC